MFRKIALEIDQELPQGLSWHTELLNRMALNIPRIRIPIIDDDLKKDLLDYLRFRYVFRNVYAFDLKWDKIHPLLEEISVIFPVLEANISRFIRFLEKITDK